MAYNQSVWARHIAAVAKYICDAVGHGLTTNLGQQCLSLASTSLVAADKAAHTPEEVQVCSLYHVGLSELRVGGN